MSEDEAEVGDSVSSTRARLKSLRGATFFLYGYGVCPGDPESSSTLSPAETSKPMSGVEQATGSLRSEATEDERIETSSSGHSRGHGGSRRASGGDDCGDDDMYSLMRSIESGENRERTQNRPKFE